MGKSVSAKPVSGKPVSAKVGKPRVPNLRFPELRSLDAQVRRFLSVKVSRCIGGWLVGWLAGWLAGGATPSPMSLEGQKTSGVFCASGDIGYGCMNQARHMPVTV